MAEGCFAPAARASALRGRGASGQAASGAGAGAAAAGAAARAGAASSAAAVAVAVVAAATGWRAGSRSATSAPPPTTAAPTHRAAGKPSTNARGEAKPPGEEKIGDKTPAPNTPPPPRSAVFGPRPRPARAGATTLSRALAEGAKTSAMPTPAMANGAARSQKVDAGPAAAASHARALLWSARPVAMNARGPYRSARMPAIGLVTAVAPVHTSIRTPASNGA